VALAIATTKMMLVVLFFMHVKYSSKLTKLTVAAGFFMFLVLVGMTLADYFTRAWDGGRESGPRERGNKLRAAAGGPLPVRGKASLHSQPFRPEWPHHGQAFSHGSIVLGRK